MYTIIIYNHCIYTIMVYIIDDWTQEINTRTKQPCAPGKRWMVDSVQYI